MDRGWLNCSHDKWILLDVDWRFVVFASFGGDKLFDWWIGPRVFVSSPFSSYVFVLRGIRGESCSETRLVRGVGDGVEAGRFVDGIGL